MAATAAMPPHVRAMADLWTGLAMTEREWLVDLVRRVDAGDLELAGGILLPMTLGPKWLQTVSDWMPFTWVTDAVRTTFSGEFAASPLLWGSVWASVLFVLAMWWGTSTFLKENA